MTHLLNGAGEVVCRAKGIKGRRRPEPHDNRTHIVHEVTCIHCLRDALVETRNKLYASRVKEG